MLFMLRSKWSILLTPGKKKHRETVELWSPFWLVDALPEAVAQGRSMK
jgi:hypothetical protein